MVRYLADLCVNLISSPLLAPVQLCDVSDWLPALKRQPGKHTWKVRDKSRWEGAQGWVECLKSRSRFSRGE